MEYRQLEESPWVIFQLKDELYGISANDVISMVVMPKVIDVPQKPHFIRGIINLRGSIMPMVDTRTRLQMQSYKEEIEDLIETMNKREQDHKNWLVELEKSVEEKREFKLTTNPHMCAFGKWYDTYVARNPSVERFLKKFDAPHKRIHSIGIHVRELVNEGKIDEAMALINKTRTGDLHIMIELFDGFRALIKNLINTEISLVVSSHGNNVAMSVDSILSVEKLKEGSIGTLPTSEDEQKDSLTSLIGTHKGTGKFVILLDMNYLVEKDMIAGMMN